MTYANAALITVIAVMLFAALYTQYKSVAPEWSTIGLVFVPIYGVLIVHLTGAERYWIGDVIAGESSDRDRDAEFKVKGVGEKELIQRLNMTEDYLRKVLETLSVQMLEEKHVSPRNGQEFTVSWALGHVLKHTALHLGHIQIMRQLWDQNQSIK